MTHRTALLWLRRDLRLADNPALRYACTHAACVVIVYVHSPDEDGIWRPGAASRWWLHHSLAAFAKTLAKRKSRLIIRSGASLPSLRKLIRETGATLVAWNRLYDPAAAQRDSNVEIALDRDGVEVAIHNAALLFEPWAIETGSGTPYRVFTPFWNNALRGIGRIPEPLPAPARICTPKRLPATQSLESLKLLPSIPWDARFKQLWRPGEAGATLRVRHFVDAALRHYPLGRNRPDEPGTSRLSPHLHFGEISPRQVLAALRPALNGSDNAVKAAAESYRRQLGWREFAYHLLHHYPYTTHKPLNKKFEKFVWNNDKPELKAWQRGNTGYPLVDAGLRELWHTGWMHNRVRMSVASFLTKNLLVHWSDGARWFWDTLVDADLANNTLGWQWVAGSGADASPYYRIFNPTLQATKFDPQRGYIRRWVPELAKLPNRYIHQPWRAPSPILDKAGVVLGKTYAAPLVDLRTSRDAALNRYKKMSAQ